MKNPFRMFFLGVTIWCMIGSLVLVFALVAHADPRVVMLTDGDDDYHANDHQMGSVTILGLAGADRIWGSVGGETENGGPGNDRLHGFQPGKDTLIGGPGWDVCVVSSIGNDETQGCEVVRER